MRRLRVQVPLPAFCFSNEGTMEEQIHKVERTFDKGEIAVITTDAGVCEAIAEELAGENRNGVIRIEFVSSGCCDASLGLRLDKIRESDLVEEVGGLNFVLSRKIYDLVGQVRISLRQNGQVVLRA